MLQLIRDGDGATRADLAALTGLARSTVAQRLDQLLRPRLVARSARATRPAGARR